MSDMSISKMSKKVLLITAGITIVLFLLNTNSIYYKQALACPSESRDVGPKVSSELIYGCQGLRSSSGS